MESDRAEKESVEPQASVHSGATRRIVTGHAADGASIVLTDAGSGAVHRFGGEGGPLFHEVWRTGAVGSAAALALPPEGGPLSLTPAAGGTLLRIVDVPPDAAEEGERLAAALPTRSPRRGRGQR